MRKFLVYLVLIFCLLGCEKQKAPVPDDDSVVYGYFKRFLSSDSSGEYLDTIQQLNIYYQTIKKYRKSSYCNIMRVLIFTIRRTSSYQRRKFLSYG